MKKSTLYTKRVVAMDLYIERLEDTDATVERIVEMDLYIERVRDIDVPWRIA